MPHLIRAYCINGSKRSLFRGWNDSWSLWEEVMRCNSSPFTFPFTHQRLASSSLKSLSIFLPSCDLQILTADDCVVQPLTLRLIMGHLLWWQILMQWEFGNCFPCSRLNLRCQVFITSNLVAASSLLPSENPLKDTILPCLAPKEATG